MKTPHRVLLVGAVCVLAAVVPLVRSQVCDAAPLFDMTGPGCNAGRTDKECACSECLTWDPAKGATWYEIRRCDDSGANCTIVGDTRWRNRPAVTSPTGVITPAIRSTVWCAAWDAPFPELGSSYEYRVRSCTDGPLGPLCNAGFSNPVGYGTAPYMCIVAGLEVPCNPGVPPSNDLATDSDGDGVTDAMDGDDDGDRVADVSDNCPQTMNLGQRDTDRDGVGDACDLEPRTPGTSPPDADRDGIGDSVDDCPWVYDPLQQDTDKDHTGDACDNCPTSGNEMQTNNDDDDEGNRCDLDDGPIYAVWSSRTQLTWAREVDFTTWCVYRGDLAVLRQSGVYAQAPGSNPRAARFCGLTDVKLTDSSTPLPSVTAFYLVGGRPGSGQTDLGLDSAGRVRPNANPCP